MSDILSSVFKVLRHVFATQISVRNLKNSNYLIVIKSIQVVKSAPAVGALPSKLLAIRLDAKSQVDSEDTITRNTNTGIERFDRSMPRSG